MALQNLITNQEFGVIGVGLVVRCSPQVKALRGTNASTYFMELGWVTVNLHQLGVTRSRTFYRPGQEEFGGATSLHGFYGRPQSVFDLSQQQTMVQVFRVSRFIQYYSVTADWMDVKEINDRQEIDQELDLELRL
ncbi:hypothetical protein HAX54_002610 [Datura stramonium]|uniref:Uncharacterized protein n=1 Tax=Datura stramonium TaxID=4076 RepID=A0ABS8WTY4_DATST|nr:hypothetical protein [Datura stramonium]